MATSEDKAERIAEYRALIAGDTAEGQFAKEIAEILKPTLTKDATHAAITFANADAAIRAGELFGEHLANVVAVEAVDAHLAINWTTYPGGNVGLDAAGNLVRVEFDTAVVLDIAGVQ